jgi:hypothetical protein
MDRRGMALRKPGLGWAHLMLAFVSDACGASVTEKSVQVILWDPWELLPNRALESMHMQFQMNTIEFCYR